MFSNKELLALEDDARKVVLGVLCFFEVPFSVDDQNH